MSLIVLFSKIETKNVDTVFFENLRVDFCFDGVWNIEGRCRNPPGKYRIYYNIRKLFSDFTANLIVFTYFRL